MRYPRQDSFGFVGKYSLELFVFVRLMPRSLRWVWETSLFPRLTMKYSLYWWTTLGYTQTGYRHLNMFRVYAAPWMILIFEVSNVSEMWWAWGVSACAANAEVLRWAALVCFLPTLPCEQLCWSFSFARYLVVSNESRFARRWFENDSPEWCCLFARNEALI